MLEVANAYCVPQSQLLFLSLFKPLRRGLSSSLGFYTRIHGIITQMTVHKCSPARKPPCLPITGESQRDQPSRTEHVIHPKTTATPSYSLDGISFPAFK